MSWLSGVFGYAWSSVVGSAIGQAVAWMFNLVLKWIQTILDPVEVVKMAVRLLTAILTAADLYLPGPAREALESFIVWLNGDWFGSLVHFSIWMIDQLLVAAVVVPLAAFILAFLPVIFGARLFVWGYHQFWGSN